MVLAKNYREEGAMMPKMRFYLRVTFVVAVALLILHRTSAFAQNNPLITVDENGNGTLLFPGGPPIPTHGVLAADPGPGGLSSVLTYNLLGPPSLVAGDVLLTDAGLLGDVIRFNPAGTGNPAYPASLLFYSDNIDGVDALGDTSGPPRTFYTNTVIIPELGNELNNGAIYTPRAGQPGFVAGFNVTYDLISDGTGVPEPASITLLGFGLAGLLIAKRKKLSSNSTGLPK
jgi:hypothetical protein